MTEGKLPDEAVYKTIDLAFQMYFHAETVVQSRLYNFLFATSILFLSCAAIYAGNNWTGGSGRHMVIVLAGLGALLSLVWLFLGRRQQKFTALHTDIVCRLEDNIPEDLRIMQRNRDLADNKTIDLHRDGVLRLRWWDSIIKSRDILILGPIAFFLAFLAILVMVFFEMPSGLPDAKADSSTQSLTPQHQESVFRDPDT